MWDQHYSSEEYIYGKEPNEFLGDTVGKIYKGKVHYEGEDRHAVFLAEHRYDVVAVHSSAN